MNNHAMLRKELEEKILSNRQQIAFDKMNMELESQLSEDNRMNPGAMEESKNFDDPASNVLDNSEISALKTAEQELESLLKQLDELGKD